VKTRARDQEQRLIDWTGKVALITGGASGIGLGIARACSARGMKLVLADLDEDTLAAAVAELKGEGATVRPLAVDVSDREAWAGAATEVPQLMGRPVQLLVNNAGVSTSGVPFEEVSPDLWDRVVGINLTGVCNGIHAFLPGMRGAGGGHIVNTSSMGGLVTGALRGPYAATKAAVIALSEVLAAELQPSSIGVSVLCPGSVKTRLWRTSRSVRGLPDIDTPPPGLTTGSADPAGMDADEVGLRVLDAIDAGEFYIFTHGEYRAPIVDKHERILASLDRASAWRR
jgi:NAD(P)-dependent dehydrogenase (short-subunit alcohol dehydrogenase family)